MPFIRITVQGLDQVIGSLNNIPFKMDSLRRDILNQTADFMVQELKRNAHVITGNMRNSVRSQHLDQNSVMVEVGANYAVYENRRGGTKIGFGPHNFADMAEQATRQRFGHIVASAYGNMFTSL